MSKRELKAHGAIYPVTTLYMSRADQCRYDQVKIPVSVTMPELGASFAAFHLDGAIELRKVLSRFIGKARTRRAAHMAKVVARRKARE